MEKTMVNELKQKLHDFKFNAKENDTGTVLSMADEIAVVSGINLAMSGEMVEFSGGESGG